MSYNCPLCQYNVSICQIIVHLTYLTLWLYLHSASLFGSWCREIINYTLKYWWNHKYYILGKLCSLLFSGKMYYWIKHKHHKHFWCHINIQFTCLVHKIWFIIVEASAGLTDLCDNIDDTVTNTDVWEIWRLLRVVRFINNIYGHAATLSNNMTHDIYHGSKSVDLPFPCSLAASASPFLFACYNIHSIYWIILSVLFTFIKF